jgi:hypothetical protein
VRKVNLPDGSDDIMTGE